MGSAISDGDWYEAISGSADGTLLVAAAHTWLYRSTDSGVTWTKVAGTNLGRFTDVWCNAAGTICMAATMYTISYQPGSLYRSVDAGASWSLVPSSSGLWQSLRCNPAGTVWIAVMFTGGFNQNGWLYKSVNSGASFVQISGTNIERWGAAACDATSTKCVVVAQQRVDGTGGLVYYSTNGFTTLNVADAPRGVAFGVAVSPDGQQAVYTQFENDEDGAGTLLPGFINYSTDGGQTFQKAATPYRRFYYGISCDAAFKMCAAGVNMNSNYGSVPMQTSCDGGRTWSLDPGPVRGWKDVKVNADGGLMYAVEDSGPTRYVWSYPLPVA